ncbi:asparagine synthase (glutamine-hydrolyzing) [Elioraea rosea]|uniref:asparagine synthase (glutamine-hydrolyzing) n=1 Tax=Elioraea rosea TaxID=2492390 RepID=UPI001184288F|nr:asparagine synthase (glutamine-hydrolyzing) [Elioraea rosea]
MCGIAGLFLRRPDDRAALLARARAMGEAIAHRGPDGEGQWADEEAGLALAHRRLAIIDLSPGGAQPMLSASGRYAISYNGELYNYVALRNELAAEGVVIDSASDTAVLLEAIAAWGLERALAKLDAMFAFALWDRAERTLTLVRDHAGIKPLAWAATAEGVFFGSELGAVEAATPPLEIDAGAVAAYLRLGCIPAPLTVFKGVRKLPPGGIVRFGMDGTVAERRWYDIAAVARDARPLAIGAEEAAARVDALLEESVRTQLVADVGVGAFLSGGVDSSSVVAAMARVAPGAAHAFTIGFDDPAYDESAAAAAIAERLGVRHTILRATGAEAVALAPELPRLSDEPFADSSQLPTLLLSRLTRGHVTVALSGDGGDELFGGYRRHRLAAGLWAKADRIPFRTTLARLVSAVPPRGWDRALAWLPGAPRRPGETLHKTALVLASPDLDAAYARLISAWEEEVAAGPEPSRAVLDLPDEPLARMRAQDAATYMHDDVLTKVDRASMSVALEVRVPMLSPAMIALAFSLPHGLLVRGDGGKAVLRDALARHLPRPFFEREKTGFSFPVGAWLRGPLREWAGDLLASPALRHSALVREAPIRAAWEEHQAGRRDRAPALWTVLMLAGWLEARA